MVRHHLHTPDTTYWFTSSESNRLFVIPFSLQSSQNWMNFQATPKRGVGCGLAFLMKKKLFRFVVFILKILLPSFELFPTYFHKKWRGVVVKGSLGNLWYSSNFETIGFSKCCGFSNYTRREIAPIEGYGVQYWTLKYLHDVMMPHTFKYLLRGINKKYFVSIV